METASWELVAQAFEPDGSLRDIYVEDTTLTDWERVIAQVRERYGPMRFTLDGEPAPLPAAVSDVFQLRTECAPRLSFSVGGIELATHFFDPTEIEFDLAPTQVDGPVRLEALVGFLRWLADLVEKPAILTDENEKGAVILRAAPTEL